MKSTYKPGSAQWLAEQRKAVSTHRMEKHAAWVARQKNSVGVRPSEHKNYNNVNLVGGGAVAFEDRCWGVMALVEEAANYNWRRCWPYFEVAAVSQSRTQLANTKRNVAKVKAACRDCFKREWQKPMRTLGRLATERIQQGRELRQKALQAGITDPTELKNTSKPSDDATIHALTFTAAGVYLFDVVHFMPPQAVLHAALSAFARPSAPAPVPVVVSSSPVSSPQHGHHLHGARGGLISTATPSITPKVFHPMGHPTATDSPPHPAPVVDECDEHYRSHSQRSASSSSDNSTNDEDEEEKTTASTEQARSQQFISFPRNTTSKAAPTTLSYDGTIKPKLQHHSPMKSVSSLTTSPVSPIRSSTKRTFGTDLTNAYVMPAAVVHPKKTKRASPPGTVGDVFVAALPIVTTATARAAMGEATSFSPTALIARLPADVTDSNIFYRRRSPNSATSGAADSSSTLKSNKLVQGATDDSAALRLFPSAGFSPTTTITQPPKAKNARTSSQSDFALRLQKAVAAMQ